MHRKDPNSTETSLGASHVREELLQQQARNNRMAQRVRTIARVAFVLLVVGIVAAIIVKPGRAIDWVGSYLVPVVGVRRR